MSVAAAEGAKRFPCAQCGALLIYVPGTAVLTCSYCGFENPIPVSTEDIEELDFHRYLEIARDDATAEHTQTVKCNACAAEFTASGDVTADVCPFCGSTAIISVPAEVRIRPRSLLPFHLNKLLAMTALEKWLASQWLSPNDLKRHARETGGLQGIYVPYWTYDTNTTTAYSGMRGEHHYRTVYYTDDEGNQQSRQERYTLWFPASGVVFNQFDDVLVVATDVVPQKHAEGLKSWDLPSLVPYQDEFLSGFRAVRYKKPLDVGFEDAKGQMAPVIDSTIRQDIGGDEQQVTSARTQYDNITFKHVLLPVWLGAYRYRDKVYNFLVNARTGEVRGDAPLSFWKILLLTLLAIALIGGFLYFYSQNQSGR
jgi:predicted RNA-binding Zn-ribbon protein involved in translation (DUF1610 family)